MRQFYQILYFGRSRVETYTVIVKIAELTARSAAESK
jgi:hypothetical protein